jgi:hypothetical protein
MEIGGFGWARVSKVPRSLQKSETVDHISNSGPASGSRAQSTAEQSHGDSSRPETASATAEVASPTSRLNTIFESKVWIACAWWLVYIVGLVTLYFAIVYYIWNGKKDFYNHCFQLNVSRLSLEQSFLTYRKSTHGALTQHCKMRSPMTSRRLLSESM